MVPGGINQAMPGGPSSFSSVSYCPAYFLLSTCHDQLGKNHVNSMSEAMLIDVKSVYCIARELRLNPALLFVFVWH